jgi:hypothetical protein
MVARHKKRGYHNGTLRYNTTLIIKNKPRETFKTTVKQQHSTKHALNRQYFLKLMYNHLPNSSSNLI